MKVTIAKWGNSYAARIPKHVMEEKGLKEGSIAEMDLTAIKKKVPSLKEMLKGLSPKDFHEEINWGPAVGKERFWENE